MTKLISSLSILSLACIAVIGSTAKKAPVAGVSESNEALFTNSLGMKFVPVPISGGPDDQELVLFSVWEARAQDYVAYVDENPSVNSEWQGVQHYGCKQRLDHPVVNVSWHDAKAFCTWLTKRERAAGKIGNADEYRLPSDHEWSCAVGIGQREDASASPGAKDEHLEAVYPWGTEWPPASIVGNFSGGEDGGIEDYQDGCLFTAAVGSYPQNELDLYDLSGNVWEWCEDSYTGSPADSRVSRGGSWSYSSPEVLLSSCRNGIAPDGRNDNCGFRVVLVRGTPSNRPRPF